MATDIPVKRLRYSTTSKQFEVMKQTSTKPFLKGPISMDWLGAAGHLPGKALQVGIAVHWLAGMNAGKPFKLTAKALGMMGVSSDAARDGLNRLESANLIEVQRMPGQRPTVALRRV